MRNLGRPWTVAEEKLLRSCVERKLSADETATELGRPYSSATRKALALGLKWQKKSVRVQRAPQAVVNETAAAAVREQDRKALVTLRKEALLLARGRPSAERTEFILASWSRAYEAAFNCVAPPFRRCSFAYWANDALPRKCLLSELEAMAAKMRRRAAGLRAAETRRESAEAPCDVAA